VVRPEEGTGLPAVVREVLVVREQAVPVARVRRVAVVQREEALVVVWERALVERAPAWAVV
jgi:hypothetical protein